MWACFWQETWVKATAPASYPCQCGGPISPTDTFSSVCLPGPPEPEFILLNQMPSHTAADGHSGPWEGEGVNYVPEPDTFLHRVTQLEQALHQGTGLEERWKKSSSTFFQGKLRWDCTGCPTVWQSSGELYLSNLLLGKGLHGPWPSLLLWFGYHYRMCLSPPHSAVFGRPCG